MGPGHAEALGRASCTRFSWWMEQNWTAASLGRLEQRRLYLIGHIDGNEPVGRV